MSPQVHGAILRQPTSGGSTVIFLCVVGITFQIVLRSNFWIFPKFCERNSEIFTQFGIN